MAKHYLAREKEWGKTLVFMPTLEQCAQFEALIKKSGKKCLFIRSGNEQAREKFENGASPLAVNCQLLTEGFDMPELQTVFVRSSSRLPMIQMAGRVLRKHPEKHIANIVQPKNTAFQAKKMAEPEQIFHWRKNQFVALKGQSNILNNTLRETLRCRKDLPKTQEVSLKDFFNVFYVAV